MEDDIMTSTPSVIRSKFNMTCRTQPDLIEIDGVRYTIITLHILAIILAVGGNLLLMYLLLKQRQFRRKVAFYMIFNLSLCDLASTVIHQPMRVFDVIAPFVDKNAFFENTIEFCTVNGFFANFFMAVSFHTIVAIALERYLLICHPFKAKMFLTKKRVLAALGAIWLLAFVLSLPYSILFTVVENVMLHRVNMSFCLMDITGHFNAGGQVFFLILFVIYFVLPVIVISYSYSRIFYSLNYTMRPVEKEQKMIQSRRSLAKVLLAVAICFILFNGPAWLTFVFISCGYHVHQDPITILMVIEFLPILSAVLNPFIYSARMRNLRKELSSNSSDDRTVTTSMRMSMTKMSTREKDYKPVATNDHKEKSVAS